MEQFEEAMIKCLTCLDKDNARFGHQQDFEDTAGAVAGARYMEKISELCSLFPH